MNEFDFWQQWGNTLSDKDFANAYTALGILASTSERKDSEISADLVLPSETELVDTLVRIISDYPSGSMMGTWLYPSGEDHFRYGANHALLKQLSPFTLAKSWENALSQINRIKICLQIKRYPVDENINPWFRILLESDPVEKSAFLDLENPALSPPDLLPARLGLLPAISEHKVSEGIYSGFPIKDISGNIQVNLDYSNCNILIFKGDALNLSETLVETPSIKNVDLFIVKGKPESGFNNNNWLIPTIIEKCSTKGFIFVNPDITDDLLVLAINKFVENLYKSFPLSFAVSNAFSKSFRTDPVIFLKENLARFQIKYLMESGNEITLPESEKYSEKIPSSPGNELPDKIPEKISLPKKMRVKLSHDTERAARGYDKEMTEVFEKITDKVPSKEIDKADKSLQHRFLQEQVFIIKKKKTFKEDRVFLKNSTTEIRVRIGLPDEEWTTVQKSFPEEKLPQDMKEWKLDVVLTEPDHLVKSLRRSITLRRQGSSSESEFRIKIADKPVFDGRVTVLYKGRILQTAVLYGRVVSDLDQINGKDKISFREMVEVRSHIGYLKDRRKYDLAFILNHTSDKRPRLTAISSGNAWCKDLTSAKEITKDLNTALGQIADSVADYKGDIFLEKNRELIVRLANLGNALYWSIVEEQFKLTSTRPQILNKENVQIVCTNPESIIPFEFIYDMDAPDNDAKPCSLWAKAFDDESCRAECALDKKRFVCPFGFWAIKKVIERHDITPELTGKGDYYIQSEPVEGRHSLSIKGSAVVGASNRVKDKALESVIQTIKNQMGSEPLKANDWNEWAKLVSRIRPNVLLALTHTDGNGIDAKLEIGGNSIESNHIREDHVRPAGEKGYPLVMLLGCDTSGTALEYGNHVQWFRRRGAGVVIGTIATVFGGHAATVAEMIISNLKQSKPKSKRLGAVIRSVKRQALQKGMIMPLCVVAYGDADWKLS